LTSCKRVNTFANQLTNMQTRRPCENQSPTSRSTARAFSALFNTTLCGRIAESLFNENDGM
jgi:hypothetical protein